MPPRRRLTQEELAEQEHADEIRREERRAAGGAVSLYAGGSSDSDSDDFEETFNAKPKRQKRAAVVQKRKPVVVDDEDAYDADTDDQEEDVEEGVEEGDDDDEDYEDVVVEEEEEEEEDDDVVDDDEEEEEEEDDDDEYDGDEEEDEDDDDASSEEEPDPKLKKYIGSKQFVLVRLAEKMLSRRTMPERGWDYESAEVLGSDDARVIAITRADFYDDMVAAIESVLEPNKVHLRKDIDWATKKGTSVMRAAFGLVENDDGVLEVSCIYVHRLMAGKLWERHLRYAGSPQFAPIVSKFVAAKWIVTRDFEGVGYETGFVDEKQTWWATANVLGEKGHLLPQMPMCAQPKGGFPRAVKSALEKLVASPNPKVARLARALLALKPGEKLEEFLDGTPFVYEGERREAHKKQSRGKTPKARAAYQRIQRHTKADPKAQFKPKDDAAAKRRKKGRAKGGAASKAPDEMPERWSSGYQALLHRKSARALALIKEHLEDAKAKGAPVRFTAQWDVDGPFIEFECVGVVVEKPAGTTAPHADYYFVETYDIATGDDYLWYTFAVADFLGLAEGLLSTLTRQQRRGGAWSSEEGRYLRDSERFAK